MVLLVLGDQLLFLASRMPVTALEPETLAGSFANLKVNEGAVILTCSRLWAHISAFFCLGFSKTPFPLAWAKAATQLLEETGLVC